MNINQLRNNLDAKLSEFGYVHPSSSNSGNPDYKVYDDKHDDVYRSQQTTTYATFNANGEDNIQNGLNCPVCNGPRLYACKCVLGDVMCKKHHIWYVKDGKVIVENPHAKKT
jgi:hypothetical protein